MNDSPEIQEIPEVPEGNVSNLTACVPLWARTELMPANRASDVRASNALQNCRFVLVLLFVFMSLVPSRVGPRNVEFWLVFDFIDFIG